MVINRMNQLYKEHEKEINKSITYFITRELKIKKSNQNYQDVFQDYILFVLENLANWDESRSALTTFIKLLCNNFRSKSYKQTESLKRKANNNPVSLNQTQTKSNSDSATTFLEVLVDKGSSRDVDYNFENDQLNKMFYDDCIEEIRMIHGEETVEVFEMFLHNYTNKEIKNELYPDKRAEHIQKMIDDSLQTLRNEKKLQLLEKN